MAATYNDTAINGTYNGTAESTYNGEDVSTGRTFPVLGSAPVGRVAGGSARPGETVSGTARRNTWQ